MRAYWGQKVAVGANETAFVPNKSQINWVIISELYHDNLKIERFPYGLFFGGV